jgi:hypothetical protein
MLVHIKIITFPPPILGMTPMTSRLLPFMYPHNSCSCLRTIHTFYLTTLSALASYLLGTMLVGLSLLYKAILFSSVIRD